MKTKSMVDLPPPPRQAQRRARRKVSSGRRSKVKLQTAVSNEQPGCACSDDERFLRSPTRHTKQARNDDGDSYITQLLFS